MNAAIRLEGAANFRDIGGCLTADGHRVNLPKTRLSQASPFLGIP